MPRMTAGAMLVRCSAPVRYTTTTTTTSLSSSNSGVDTTTVRADDSGAAAATRPLVDVDGVSESDKELIRQAMTNPETQNATMGGHGIGPQGGEMVAVFTCEKCDARFVKRFSKQSYTKGIVIVECPGCTVKHLIADNLGWFTDSEDRTIEDVLRSKGETVTRIGNVHVE